MSFGDTQLEKSNSKIGQQQPGSALSSEQGRC